LGFWSGGKTEDLEKAFRRNYPGKIWAKIERMGGYTGFPKKTFGGAAPFLQGDYLGP